MVGTMGVALSVCTLPGQVTSDRLGPGKMELGLGIVKFYCTCLMLRSSKTLLESCLFYTSGAFHFMFCEAKSYDFSLCYSHF